MSGRANAMTSEQGPSRKCFVVMGFGEKTDFQSNPQRVLNLNRTYEDIIQPAVTAAGFECVRADQIIHSTLIDKPMYERLLEADLVVADLSTSNANAIYELGVRHALRPRATIVIAEDKFAFPFDLNHVSILKYEHLGKEIGFREVMRMREALQKRIAAIAESDETDSPVYLFLPKLLNRADGAVPQAMPTAVPEDEKSLADLLESLRQAKNDAQEPSDWLIVIAVLNRLRKLQPNDPYIIQQTALATYKSRHPDPLQALQNARAVLSALTPQTSSDAETVGLWGAIHKRLWDMGRDRAHLDEAIRAYARGYFIKNDYYNGINFAFLLDVRAGLLEGDESIADRVLARRIRAEVLELCEAALATGTLKEDDVFWAKATKVEALTGLARIEEAKALQAEILAQDPRPAQWMITTMQDQIGKLVALRS